MEFIITHTDEVLVSHSGLALAGALLQQSPLRQRLNEIRLGERKRPALPHGDVLLSMLGLLCLGKSDYADIEAKSLDCMQRSGKNGRNTPHEGVIAGVWVNAAPIFDPRRWRIPLRHPRLRWRG